MAPLPVHLSSPLNSRSDLSSAAHFNLNQTLHKTSLKIMKIFNWVHRRFVHKDGLPQNGKKMTGGVVADDDNDGQFLIDQNSNGFSGWKGGILTIGTFGYDPILLNNDSRGHQIEHDDDNSLIYAPEKEQVVGNDQINDNYQVITDHSDGGGGEEGGEEEEEEYDNEEANPLLYAVYVRDYGYDYEGLMKMKMGSESRVSHDDENTKKAGRTTLADLFSADNSTDTNIDLQKKLQAPIINGKEADDDDQMMMMMMMKKVKSSFANKLDARPIHKLNRLMRRMMKRKIHPAADLGLNKDYYPTNYSEQVACDIGGESALPQLSLAN